MDYIHHAIYLYQCVTDYIRGFVQTEKNVIVFCVRHIFEHMLDYVPMRSARIVHKSADDSYGVRNVRPCRDHCVHK